MMLYENTPPSFFESASICGKVGKNTLCINKVSIAENKKDGKAAKCEM